MWKLNLQLFAEDEQNPAEVAEAESVEATDEDVEFEDSEDEVTEKQTKQKNNEYAQKRIKARREAEQKQLEEERRKAFLQGVQKGNEGKNRFTGREIKDEEDLQEFELMLEMEEKGLDPVDDYTEYVKEKRRAERQAEAQKNLEATEAQKRSTEDVKQFCEKYDQTTAQKIFQDKGFLKFAEGMLGLVPLTTIYEKYLDTQLSTETQAEKLALEKDARRKASSGSLTEKPAPARKPFSEMTSEEFRAFQNSLL
jgi:hypothetical protein